jgi:hypothetical protein
VWWLPGQENNNVCGAVVAIDNPSPSPTAPPVPSTPPCDPVTDPACPGYENSCLPTDPNCPAHPCYNINGQTVSVSVAAVASEVEGNPGNTVQVEFTVTLDQPIDGTVTVTLSTADGTALAGQDYEALSNHTVAFSPNSTSPQSVFVNVIEDDVTESPASEAFTLQINSATISNGATDCSSQATVNIAAGSAQGNIDDDDVPAPPANCCVDGIHKAVRAFYVERTTGFGCPYSGRWFLPWRLETNYIVGGYPCAASHWTSINGTKTYRILPSAVNGGECPDETVLQIEDWKDEGASKRDIEIRLVKNGDGSLTVRFRGIGGGSGTGINFHVWDGTGGDGQGNITGNDTPAPFPGGNYFAGSDTAWREFTISAAEASAACSLP